MARCNICDAPLTNIAFNRDHGDIDPCSKCLEIIHDVFTDPVPEEDLRDDPSIEEVSHDFDDFSNGRIDVV